MIYHMFCPLKIFILFKLCTCLSDLECSAKRVKDLELVEACVKVLKQFRANELVFMIDYEEGGVHWKQRTLVK